VKYIWSLEKLTTLVRHQDPEVREWAMDKLAALYPQAASDAAVTLLDDKNVSVSGIAVDYLLDHPSESHKVFHTRRG
jgi:HEAT repeat protein